MVSLETRSVGTGAHRYFWSPTKFFKYRIGFYLDGIGNNFAQYWSKFKSVSAITRGDHKTFAFRIGRDPEISIMRFAVHAYAGVNNWSIGQPRERPRQKFPQARLFLGSNGPLGRF